MSTNLPRIPWKYSSSSSNTIATFNPAFVYVTQGSPALSEQSSKPSAADVRAQVRVTASGNERAGQPWAGRLNPFRIPNASSFTQHARRRLARRRPRQQRTLPRAAPANHGRRPQERPMRNRRDPRQTVGVGSAAHRPGRPPASASVNAPPSVTSRASASPAWSVIEEGCNGEPKNHLNLRIHLCGCAGVFADSLGTSLRHLTRIALAHILRLCD